MNGMSAEAIQKERDLFLSDFLLLEKEVSKSFVSQKKILREVLVAFIAGGHVLLEGIPGLGKTLLVRSVAEAVNGKYSRIQFTPDLIPADIIGTEIIVHKNRLPQFEFRKGPLFANILLADEINRAAPKTQSALLEAMEESAVTVGGVRYPLEGGFSVMATQNPIEMEGTYPLPEAQLDRFFAKILVPYPTTVQLTDILKNSVKTDIPKISAVLSTERLINMGHFVRTVPVAPTLLTEVARLISSTCPNSTEAPDIFRRLLRYGASPRAAKALLLAARVFALLDQRYNVDKEDIRTAMPMILRHRLVPNYEGIAEQFTSEKIIDTLLERF